MQCSQHALAPAPWHSPVSACEAAWWAGALPCAPALSQGHYMEEGPQSSAECNGNLVAFPPNQGTGLGMQPSSACCPHHREEKLSLIKQKYLFIHSTGGGSQDPPNHAAHAISRFSCNYGPVPLFHTEMSHTRTWQLSDQPLCTQTQDQWVSAWKELSQTPGCNSVTLTPPSLLATATLTHACWDNTEPEQGTIYCTTHSEQTGD